MGKKYVIDNTTLTAIADSIRTKKGTSANIKPENMAAEISGITASEDLDAVLTEQEGLIDELKSVLNGKARSLEIARSIADRTIVSYSDDEITTLGAFAFQTCSKLVEVNIPNVTTLGAKSFSQCSALQRIELPNLKTLGGDCFTYCYALKYVDLGQVTALPSWSVSNCTVLETVVIRKSDKIATLSTTNALANTPIASGTGYIYVPSELIDSYKSATNWSTYANQIRAIEDYPDITGG